MLCVTLNAALDVTYAATAVVTGEVNRVEQVHVHAGGKGVNVARLLHGWGRTTTVLGFAGGPVGDQIGASLTEAGLVHDLVRCREESRRTVTVVEEETGSATGFYEAGPTISTSEWEAFRAAFDDELSSVRLVVLSGSQPPGIPPDAYRQLTATAVARGLPVIVDAHGQPLLQTLTAGPSIVTPNEAELADALGLARPVTLEAAVEAAHRLAYEGAGRVVVTLGARGLIGATPDSTWLAQAPVVVGNPTGAGDAVVAVLADSELSDRSWPETLRLASATAAAAVCRPMAGSVDHTVVTDLLERVEVREL